VEKFAFNIWMLLVVGLGLPMVHAQTAPIVVAVIDSGFIIQHPSLEGRFLPGVDMTSGTFNLRGSRSTNIEPDEWDAQCPNRQPITGHRSHGTEVASVLVGNGRKGVRGVAENAMVLPVRAIGACGMQVKDLIDAMAWSAGLSVEGLPQNSYPAKVINISLAGGAKVCRPALQSMVDQLNDKGVFVVAAAGNNFGQALQEPANCNGVLSVGAVNQSHEVTGYSALDPRTAVYAYAGTHQKGLWGKIISHGLRVASMSHSEPGLAGLEQTVAHHGGVGTSFAAPYVSGLIANLLHQQPSLTFDSFMSQLDKQTIQGSQPQGCKTCNVRVMAKNTTQILENLDDLEAE
jgi:serine protease